MPLEHNNKKNNSSIKPKPKSHAYTQIFQTEGGVFGHLNATQSTIYPVKVIRPSVSHFAPLTISWLAV